MLFACFLFSVFVGLFVGLGIEVVSHDVAVVGLLLPVVVVVVVVVLIIVSLAGCYSHCPS